MFTGTLCLNYDCVSPGVELKTNLAALLLDLGNSQPDTGKFEHVYFSRTCMYSVSSVLTSFFLLLLFSESFSKMYKEAEKLSKQALKLDPNDVSSQANLRAAQYSMKIR